jgi:hypothetical protein
MSKTSRASPKPKLEQDTLEDWIKRYRELRDAYQEYCRLGKLIKRAVQGKRRLLVGDYLVIGRWVIRKSYVVPESKYWHMKIEHIAKE